MELRTVAPPEDEDVPVQIRTETDIRKKIARLWEPPDDEE
jgi:hypothetical protein